MIHVKKIVTHPLFIILFFCAIIISGEQMGGFYLLYILMGLPHFVLHAVLGVLGIACLLFTYYGNKKTKYFCCVLGAVFMIASLLYFFLRPSGAYNYNTFHETLPLSTLIVFSVLIVFFIVKNVFALFHNIHPTEYPVQNNA